LWLLIHPRDRFLSYELHTRDYSRHRAKKITLKPCCKNLPSTRTKSRVFFRVSDGRNSAHFRGNWLRGQERNIIHPSIHPSGIVDGSPPWVWIRVHLIQLPSITFPGFHGGIHHFSIGGLNWFFSWQFFWGN
jgi:hypothetical protein